VRRVRDEDHLEGHHVWWRIVALVALHRRRQATRLLAELEAHVSAGGMHHYRHHLSVLCAQVDGEQAPAT